MSNTTKNIDAATGSEIRSHEWDGIQELNTPLPRWWLWTFLATVLWAIAYWVVMPAWPMIGSYTKGAINWSQRSNVDAEMKATAAARLPLGNRLVAAKPGDIEADPQLLEFALASGRALFKDNCAPCHGAGAQGAVGYPNLNDDDWLWGGSLSEIEETITYGVRNTNDKSRFSEMPAFVKLGTLNRMQAADVVEYVESLSGRQHSADAAKRGGALFAENCASCHGETGHGDRTQGAPNLTDQIWLHGGTRIALTTTISNARNGSMPAWGERLKPAEVRALAVYVHSLGGGEPEHVADASAKP
ncbi:MAG: cytochrome-c oxidase, cbb3-type subunit III [Rhodospirillaceae bacterium]|nr:cytochrome-c oxidase, cbb3-type subunit III [Rhodospirillaceae bacterium]